MAKRKDLSRMHSNMLKVKNPLKQFHGPMAAEGGENKGSTGVDLPRGPEKPLIDEDKAAEMGKNIKEQKEKEAAEALRRKNNQINNKPTDLDETENMTAAEIRSNMLNRSFPSQRRDL